MGFVLVFIGVVLLVTALRGTTSLVASLLLQDLQGYVWFVVVIFVLGALGYIKSLKGLSLSFMALVLIALILRTDKNGQNVVQSFNEQVKQSFT